MTAYCWSFGFIRIAGFFIRIGQSPCLDAPISRNRFHQSCRPGAVGHLYRLGGTNNESVVIMVTMVCVCCGGWTTLYTPFATLRRERVRRRNRARGPSVFLCVSNTSDARVVSPIKSRHFGPNVPEGNTIIRASSNVVAKSAGRRTGQTGKKFG